jgi:hypothetical protein
MIFDGGARAALASALAGLVACSSSQGAAGGDGGPGGSLDGGTHDGAATGDGRASEGGGTPMDGGGVGAPDASLETSPPATACTAGNQPTTYNGLGSGTAADPYLLCNAAQLVSLSSAPSAWKSAYRLGADVDLSGNGPGSASPFTGIGTTQTPFSGTFDGAGHGVSNLTLSAGTDTGFFGVILGGATEVRSLALVGANVTGSSSVGILVGRCDRGARILGSSTQGSVQGDSDVGGLLGSGRYGPVVSSSWSSATVKGNQRVGGLVGSMSQGAFIFNSYATGAVTGDQATGGFVGSIDSGGVYNSYATSNVTSTSTTAIGVSGFAGSVHGTIYQNCLATGTVTANTTSTSTVDWFLGDAPYGTYTNDYYLPSSKCQVNPTTPCLPDGNDKALTQIPNATQPPLSSWDFVHTWSPGSGTLPTLKSTLFDANTWDGCSAHAMDTPFAGGDGTPDRPYLICTAKQFANLSSTTGSGFYVEQMASVDFSSAGVTLAPIGGGSTWVGVYNGNGKTLSNFSLTAASGQVGLFGSITGTIERMGVVNGSVTGGSGAMSTGMIAGYLYGTINDSYATGTVTGPTQVSALANAHTTLGCYASVTVTATTGIGGGLNTTGGADGLVVDSFASSMVSAPGGAYALTPPVNASGQNYDSFYDSSKCGACQAVYATPEASTSYFFSSTNPPMNAWDFNTIWLAQPNGFPVLR